MTSDEIKALAVAYAKAGIQATASEFWLKEIAYQLALMNEGCGRFLAPLADSEPDKRVDPILQKYDSDILDRAERGKRDAQPGAANVPTGWRCGACNYGRDFTDQLLTDRGRRSLEDGFCPACGAEDLRIAFPPGAQNPETPD